MVSLDIPIRNGDISYFAYFLSSVPVGGVLGFLVLNCLYSKAVEICFCFPGEQGD